MVCFISIENPKSPIVIISLLHYLTSFISKPIRRSLEFLNFSASTKQIIPNEELKRAQAKAEAAASALREKELRANVISKIGKKKKETTTAVIPSNFELHPNHIQKI